MIVQYKYKFFLNAMHYVIFNEKKGEAHSHCFELVIDIAAMDESMFTMFNDIEKKLDDILAPYQDKLLNDIIPFDKTNPTIENICQVFKKKFADALAPLGWALLCIEISESPSRSYIINAVEEGLLEELGTTEV